MTMCSYCGHDVPHPCPSDEHRENCEWPDVPRPEPAFNVGDVVYILRENPEIGFPRGSEVRIHSLPDIGPPGTPPAAYITSPLRMGVFYYGIADLSHNAPPVRPPLCRFCNNRTETPCERARDADQCERTGILRVGRDANVFVDGAPGEVVPATLSLPRIRMVETDPSIPIRTTMGDLVGTIGLSDEERGTVIAAAAARATEEHERETADLERQRLTLNGAPSPGISINWDAVQTNYRDCAQCGERVSHPCESPGVALGCELPGRVYQERFSRMGASAANARLMPPAIRAIARRSSTIAERIISQVEQEERDGSPGMEHCNLCGSPAARPCTTSVASERCDMPRRFLEASGWLNGGVSGRDFPPAVRALCASIQRTREPGYSMVAPVPEGGSFGAFAVRNLDGILDVDTVSGSWHASAVTFLVARRGHRPEPLTADVEAATDAWEQGPEQEGFRIVQVVVREPATVAAASAEGSPWNVEVPQAPPPPPVYREPAQRRRAIRLLNGS